MAKDRKKIIHFFPGFGVGGSQSRLADLADIWGEGVEHDLFAFDGDYSAIARFSDKITVRKIDLPLRKGAFFYNVKILREFLKKNQYSSVNTYNWGSVEVAFANFPQITKHIHNEDGFGTDEANGFKKRRIYMRKIALSGKTLILPSQKLFSIANEIWKPFASERVFIPNGTHIPSVEFLQTIVKGSEKDPFLQARADGSLIIGTVATLRPEKALHVLINAVGELNKAGIRAKGVIVGGGSEREFLENYARSVHLTDKIIFTGARNDAVRTLLPYFDIFAMSSVTEQQPLSVLEAGAANLPVVATQAGDIADMVADESKIYIVPQNLKSLTAALVKLCHDPEARAAAGALNRKKVIADYHIERCAERRLSYMIPA